MIVAARVWKVFAAADESAARTRAVPTSEGQASAVAAAYSLIAQSAEASIEGYPQRQEAVVVA